MRTNILIKICSIFGNRGLLGFGIEKKKMELRYEWANGAKVRKYKTLELIYLLCAQYVQFYTERTIILLNIRFRFGQLLGRHRQKSDKLEKM